MPETAYDRITFHGKPLDRATADALRRAEDLLGYELTVVQGIGGATASAGTHTEGRAVDLAPWDHDRKVRILKQIGFAAWHRPALPGVWGEHIHAVLFLDTLVNDRGIAPAAERQLVSFRDGRNGLANNATDPEPFRVTPQPVFKWPPVTPKPSAPKRTSVTRARNALVEAHAALLAAAALLDDADPTRVVARAQRDEIRASAADVVASLRKLPKR